MAGKRGQRSRLPTDVRPRFSEDFLEDMDQRGVVPRTLRERLRGLINDLGGIDTLSYQERSLSKRAVHLERLIEKYEITLAHGGTVDTNSYLAAINALSSLFNRLGLKRRAKQLPSLVEYVRTQQPTTQEEGR